MKGMEDILVSIEERKNSNRPPVLSKELLLTSKSEPSSESKTGPLSRKEMNYVINVTKRPLGFEICSSRTINSMQRLSTSSLSPVSSVELGVESHRLSSSSRPRLTGTPCSVDSNCSNLTDDSVDTEARLEMIWADQNGTCPDPKLLARKETQSTHENGRTEVNAYVCHINPAVPFDITDGSMVVSVNHKDVVGMAFTDIFKILHTEDVPIRLELALPPKLHASDSMPGHTEQRSDEPISNLKEEEEQKIRKKSLWSNVFHKR
ncbi:hypothetical protein RFI_24982 [Reticulomyxa filosa]|uniref:PDZ domain-containing protein n=1 Tax=Reticulomyxa filosa TaxID=46433 RepID=X6MH84_RETFI|nr:hypothetical protein RFI_24982 [Reticulomyxa filosa]|eukprot:ETO12395.1 hypothetical protein RFI_24982 [Reticulomyxa filosa]